MTQHESVRFKIMRNGAEYAEIFPDGSAPTLKGSTSGEIKTSLKGTFMAAAKNASGKTVEVDWLSDEIKPVLLRGGIEHPLGVLIPTTISTDRSATKDTISIEAYDRCWRVKDTRKETLAHFTQGTLYLTAIESLLTDAGISAILSTNTDLALTEDREDWDLAESNLTIANQLLGEINYNQVWFNSDGAAVLEPASTPSTENIEHVFTSRKTDPRNQREIEIINILPELSRQTDFYSTPNVFLCICSNPDKSGAMVATAENNNPQSPLSIPRRGRRIVKVARVNNIASQAELQNYADRMASDSLLTGETITVSTALQPGFGIGDIVAIDYGDIVSVCVEKSWTMELKPGGKMKHELERVVLNFG